MATIIRCDKCKGLSDDPDIGPVNKYWHAIEYKSFILSIKAAQDLCQKCIRSSVTETQYLSPGTHDIDY